MDSAKLRRGTKVPSFNGEQLTVVNVQALGRSGKTFNLTVADFHTFFAGEASAYVHNQCPCALAAKETTPLFRAVGPAELADIKATRALRNLGSAEGKYFMTSAAEAYAYAKQAVKAFGDQPYTIIRKDVPNSIFKGLSPATVDRGIPAWVIPMDRLPGLVPNVMNHSPLPPMGF